MDQDLKKFDKMHCHQCEWCNTVFGYDSSDEEHEWYNPDEETEFHRIFIVCPDCFHKNDI